MRKKFAGSLLGARRVWHQKNSERRGGVATGGVEHKRELQVCGKPSEQVVVHQEERAEEKKSKSRLH